MTAGKSLLVGASLVPAVATCRGGVRLRVGAGGGGWGVHVAGSAPAAQLVVCCYGREHLGVTTS